jgi:hypothetical protein
MSIRKKEKVLLVSSLVCLTDEPSKFIMLFPFLVLTYSSFYTVCSQSLSRSLHHCTPSNPSTISPIEILSSDLLVEWNGFGQYWRRCVELCDWIFQPILLASTVRWAWIHNGYKKSENPGEGRVVVFPALLSISSSNYRIHSCDCVSTYIDTTYDFFTTKWSK